ncbi:hypothetical protein GQX74_013485 [Glossina fuscipes]|nr:hypothetical protein GQX74_013485 [Glossina fuscipes]
MIYEYIYDIDKEILKQKLLQKINEQQIDHMNTQFILLPSSSSDSEISESELSSEIASPCMGFIVIVKAESSQRAMDTPLKRITENTQTSIISVVGCELPAAKYKHN